MDKVQKVEKLFTSRQSFSKSVRVTRKKYASDLFSGRHEPVFYYVYVPPVKLGMASYVPHIYVYHYIRCRRLVWPISIRIRLFLQVPLTSRLTSFFLFFSIARPILIDVSRSHVEYNERL